MMISLITVRSCGTLPTRRADAEAAIGITIAEVCTQPQVHMISSVPKTALFCRAAMHVTN
jgi:hypothetical protein